MYGDSVLSYLKRFSYGLVHSIDKKGYVNVKKSIKIIADKKLLLTFADVFDDRMKGRQ